MTALWLMLAGGLGATLRFAVALLLARGRLARYPAATFAVNVLGAFAMGAVAAAITRGVLSLEVQLVVGVGLLGGFTTYSTFNEELARAWREGRGALAVAYAGLTLSSALGAGVLGARLFTSS